MERKAAVSKQEDDFGMRMRKKKNLQPRMERCSDCWIKAPQELRGNWSKLMPTATALHLELGCGKGRFTCEMAAQHPEVLFIALEMIPDAMIIAMERAKEEGLSNVFFIDGFAERLFDYFADGEFDRIYINFCDPWPSKRHAKRRLTHENFLKRYRLILKDAGEIHFKTDNCDLFEFSLLQFPMTGFDLQEVTRNLHQDGIRFVMTDYEEKFHGQGMPINRCVGIKTDLPPQEALEAKVVDE